MTFFWFVKQKNSSSPPYPPAVQQFLIQILNQKGMARMGCSWKKRMKSAGTWVAKLKGTTVHPEKGTRQVPVPAKSPNQQHPWCLLTFGSLLQQPAALQFSLQATHTSQIHQGSTLLFHFIPFKKWKCWVLVSFPLPTTRNTWCTLVNSCK